MSDGTPDFGSIHERFRPKVLRYLTRMVGESEAEDLAQAVMLKVSDGLRGFRGESAVSTWIYRIAHNAALDALRKRSPGPAPLDVLRSGQHDADVGGDDAGSFAPEAQTPSVESLVMREEMNACIREFIERLPEPYRAVMVLAELEGFRNAEIAEILGVSLDTVKIRLHRARERLRGELASGCSFHRDVDRGLGCEPKSGA